MEVIAGRENSWHRERHNGRARGNARGNAAGDEAMSWLDRRWAELDGQLIDLEAVFDEEDDPGARQSLLAKLNQITSEEDESNWTVGCRQDRNWCSE